MKKQSKRKQSRSATKHKKPSKISSQSKTGAGRGTQDDDVESTSAALGQWVRNDSSVEDPTGKLAALQLEAIHILRNGPPIAVLHHEDMAAAYSGHLQRTAEKYKDTLRSLGIDVDQRVSIGDGQCLEYDFSPVRFQDVERRYRSNLAYLILQGAFAAPGQRMRNAPVALKLPWWLTKLLSMFEIEAEDIEDVGDAFVEVIGEDLCKEIGDKLREAVEKAFEEEFGEVWQIIYEACELIRKALNKLRENIIELWEKLVEKFAKRMGRKEAKEKAKKIVAKFASRFVPILGWTVMFWDLFILLARNINDILWA